MSRMYLLTLFVAVRALSAQNPLSPAHVSWTGLSQSAQQEIHQVETAVASLSTPDAARKGGFEPVLGWIPTMGTHWVNGARMLTGRRFNTSTPSQLMFSPVNGKETLVGAAFAYLAATTDSERPASFDGNPSWHEHPDLAPPGTTLVMLHVWLVPSPDGPFAGHNPFLPFWAVGLTPPDTTRMRDAAGSLRVRKAALALSEVADTNGLFPVIARRPAVRTVLVERRAAVRALIPQLETAQQARDWRRWDLLADSLAAHWDAMRQAYLTSAINPAVNAHMVKMIDDMTASNTSATHHH